MTKTKHPAGPHCSRMRCGDPPSRGVPAERQTLLPLRKRVGDVGLGQGGTLREPPVRQRERGRALVRAESQGLHETAGAVPT